MRTTRERMKNSQLLYTTLLVVLLLLSFEEFLVYLVEHAPSSRQRGGQWCRPVWLLVRPSFLLSLSLWCAVMACVARSRDLFQAAVSLLNTAGVKCILPLMNVIPLSFLVTLGLGITAKLLNCSLTHLSLSQSERRCCAVHLISYAAGWQQRNQTLFLIQVHHSSVRHDSIVNKIARCHFIIY